MTKANAKVEVTALDAAVVIQLLGMHSAWTRLRGSEHRQEVLGMVQAVRELNKCGMSVMDIIGDGKDEATEVEMAQDADRIIAYLDGLVERLLPLARPVLKAKGFHVHHIKDGGE